MLRRSFLALSILALSAPVYAAEVEIGAKAPELKGLIGTDGKEYNLADIKDDIVVICFTCNICPVAVAYEDRFIEFQKKYAAKGVKFIAVNANKKTEDIAVMKTRVEEKGINYPYVYDKTGESATAYGARVTPHIFVLSKDRKVSYVGSFDDKQNGPTKHYVSDAVDALLAGKKVEFTNSKAFGCGIQN